MRKYKYLLLILLLSFTSFFVMASVQQELSVEGSLSFQPASVYFEVSGTNITGYDNKSGEKHVVTPEGTISMSNGVINNNNSIEILEISSSVTTIGWLNLLNCPNLHTIILHAENPVTRWTSIFGLQLGSKVKIYVPDSVYNTYKTTSGWSQFTEQIYRYSEYEVD